LRTVPERTEDVEIRVSVREKRAWQSAARALGRTLSDWLRDLANQAVAERTKERT
jgi:uncharacterized protein (DUF1778 family)